MRTVLATLLAIAVVVAAGAFGVIYSGLYNVGATDPHAPLVHWVLETARTRSIKAHAASIMPPPGLDAPQMVLKGTEHFAAHCAVCHGAPGVPSGDIAHGMYPAPPNLATIAGRYSPAELFWVVRNGIKSSGMPAWGDHGDGELWAIVAFLLKLPTMTEQAYGQLIMENIVHGGEHHHGGT
jgi:mono/diheme cytochrome c family protein